MAAATVTVTASDTRTMPLEVPESILPADRYLFRYDIDVPKQVGHHVPNCAAAGDRSDTGKATDARPAVLLRRRRPLR
jgi:hypothetical protein